VARFEDRCYRKQPATRAFTRRVTLFKWVTPFLLFNPKGILNKSPSTSSEAAKACVDCHAPENALFVHVKLGVMAEVDDPLEVVSTPEIDKTGRHLL
jgi:hypothetical protein